MSQQGDNVIVRFGIAVLSNTGNNGQPHMQVLTPHDERVPVPLGSLRNFADIRRTLRLILHATMSNHGILSTDMTHCAAILPASRRPQNNGLLGITDDERTWQSYTNIIASMYHPPCQTPENCSQCREPGFVIACFPRDAWNEDPGRNIAMRDNYNAEHGTTLRRISPIEQQRYIRIIQQRVNAGSRSNAPVSSPNSLNQVSSLPQPGLTSTTQQAPNPDPTKGPKGRTLMGTTTSTNQKPKDYSKATLRPANTEQGIKAESDTCLTCIKYNRRCTGTTMKLVSSSRKARKSQWKCDKCRNPQRRCLWRPSMAQETTYEEAFKADGGKTLEKNTTQGRKERAEKRSAATKAEQDDGHEEDDSDEGDIEDDDEE